MLRDLITRSLLVPEVVLIMKTLTKESVSDPGSALYTFQDRSWKISRSWCILFDQTLHCQPLAPAGIFGVRGGLLEVMLHSNSTSSIRSSRSELALWKNVYLLEGMGFQQRWQVLMLTQFHIQRPSICTLNGLQTTFCKKMADLRLQAYEEACMCVLVRATYWVTKYSFFSSKWGHFWEMGTFWLVPHLLFEG